MFRRLLTAATVLLVLGSSLAPTVVFAIGAPESGHTDCCCPDPALCPIVRGEHLCSWMKRGEKPAETAPEGPRITRCADADAVFERADAVTWLPSPPLAVSALAQRTLRVLPPHEARTRGPDAPEIPPPRS